MVHVREVPSLSHDAHDDKMMQQRSETTAELDALFRRANDIQNISRVCEFMEWMSKVKTYSLFNLWLAWLQRPGCGAIATTKRWRELDRRIKPTATPIVILRPMGPVMVVYEVGDTSGEPLPKSLLDVEHSGSERDLDQLARLALDRLARHATKQGIQIDRVKMGINLGGEVHRNVSGDLPADFLIHLNEAHPFPTQYATLCHELAHIYCGHCGRREPDWWMTRPRLGVSEMEFEAEGAAYLVLSRAGCISQSAEYLARYAKDCDMTKISMDAIIRAANRIERQSGRKMEIT